MERKCIVLYVTEEKEHLTVYSSPTFLFREMDWHLKSNMMSIYDCQDQIREFFRKGRFHTLESFKKAIEELTLKVLHDRDKVYNPCDERNVSIRELLMRQSTFPHVVYIYNGSSCEVEILNQARFVDLLAPGHIFYDGGYSYNKIPREIRQINTTLNYDTKFYKDEILPSYYMKKYGVTEEEMNQILDYFGPKMVFEMVGVFNSEEGLARYWITSILEIEGEVLNCINYKKYGKFMLEHAEDYEKIFKFGEKYVLCFPDE